MGALKIRLSYQHFSSLIIRC